MQECGKRRVKKHAASGTAWEKKTPRQFGAGFKEIRQEDNLFLLLWRIGAMRPPTAAADGHTLNYGEIEESDAVFISSSSVK